MHSNHGGQNEAKRISEPSWKPIGIEGVRAGRQASCCFLLGTFVLGLTVMGAVQFASFMLWPACKDGVPCKDRPGQAEKLREIAREVTPVLMRNQAHSFAALGRKADRDSDCDGCDGARARTCVDVAVQAADARFGDNYTSSPARIRAVVRYMRLENVSSVRRALGPLWWTPVRYADLIEQAAACARTNKPLVAYLCAALDDLSLRPSFDEVALPERLSWAAHLFLVLEKLGASARDSPLLKTEVTQQLHRVSEAVVRGIIELAERDGTSDEVRAFRIQKWRSLSSPDGDLALRLHEQHYLGAYLPYVLQLNILEAAKIDHDKGAHVNRDLGLALSAYAVAQLPTVDQLDRLHWTLGKDWTDAYHAWNMNYVAQFGQLMYFPKLLIPSVQCSSEPATAVNGWSPPTPQGWWVARLITLHCFMVFMTHARLDGMFSAPDMGAPQGVTQLRNDWSTIITEASNVPPPEDCCGRGTLRALFDKMLPYRASFLAPTSEMDDKIFLLYATLVVWAVTVMTGFGTELVAGVNLIRIISSGNGRILWRFMQLVFGLFLTVACFSRSIFGLPFLVLGLWKGGFPETTGCLMAAYHEGRIRIALPLSLDASGLHYCLV